MRADDLQALSHDAAVVHDIMATLRWWARGLVSGASSRRQLEEAERVLGLIERAGEMSDVVSVGIQRLDVRETARRAESDGKGDEG